MKFLLRLFLGLALTAGLIALAVFGVLMSVVGAFYYLRIVKIMYFDSPVGEFDVEPSRGLKVRVPVVPARKYGDPDPDVGRDSPKCS